MITVRYFARLREDVGTSEEQLELPSGVSTAGTLRAWIRERGSPWSEALGAPALLVAVNHETTGPDGAIGDGDEVAFFPPVTGG